MGQWPPAVLALTKACPGIQLSQVPTLQGNWWELATRLRRSLLRFLDPAYRGMPRCWCAGSGSPAVIRLAEFPGSADSDAP